MSTPSQIPEQPAAAADEDTVLLRQLLPAEPASRKRAFSHLLRQIVTDKAGSR